ncbi:hypothetical protein OH77DRAFT_1436130 [Trametes cingulata]|nr:hypothetical protein OH77DRAFT_1436130 [Trametes cingulata]
MYSSTILSMMGSAAAAAALLVAAAPPSPFATQRFADLPLCTLECIAESNYGACHVPYNDTCFCGDLIFLGPFQTCVEDECGAGALQSVQDIIVEACEDDGITVTSTPLLGVGFAQGTPTARVQG